ncbi:CBF/Mak21 family domain-containing protein [Trichoderma breve]|uniref:CBF/Mak21 family domain-containing protein n=1 Tax=Trichoderma breve TaxID=2034170 RepID=A0A9W9E5U6_9HYPO|nr:CBF/Mak21 family domain-containing protein [Trichoderma breve]KAJ4860178.1 CBF/Mak21 family domain-containing protein [Trichoderma breve]
MAKHSKKAKGPQRSENDAAKLKNGLSELTTQIQEKLNGNPYNKRKNPPTEASGKQKQRKQRDSEGAPPAKSTKAEEEALLAEIKALGGDEEDWRLINEVGSDDEAVASESKAPVDKRLKEELAALSKELGFAGLAPVDASDDEEEEEGDQEEEDEGEDSDDDVSIDDGKNKNQNQNNNKTKKESKEKGPVENDMRRVEGLIFEPRADWHAARLAQLPGPTVDDIGPFMSAINSLKEHGKYLLETEAAKYRTTIFASSSHKFLATIMTSGTLTDKVSALTLACQESPVHNIRAFDTLMNLASKKSRAQAIGAIGALVDMLGPGSLQRASAKIWAPSQPLPGKITQAHLISWAYEDWLKETYFKIIQLLEIWCSDEIEYSRMRAVDFVYALLKDKPEQESNLLTLLVNKLGDRDRKISSRASYLLLQLQNSHPGMKPVIVRTVEQEILLRPSQDHRSRYYAINTLNQTILSNKEPAVAESLLRIYFDLFATILKTGKLGMPIEEESSKPQKGQKPETEAADKLVSALLTGVNRAAPFVGTNDMVMERHLDTLFKIAHSSNFNTGIQALLLIQHLSSARNLGSDRFYRTLYESLLDPRLMTSSKQALYLNLLLRALKNDVDVRRVKAFAKRMLQVAGLHQPPFICGLLYVISHLRQTFPDLSTLVESPEESVFDDEEPENRPTYDGRKRNPEHSNAHRSCLWEVVPIQSHFHPAVSKFASSLMDRNQKMLKPDMESHSLIRFLDKFVYRNAKTTDARGASIMQPLKAAKDIGDIWLGSGRTSSSTTQVNSAAFWNKKAEDVAAEDVFFHKYFQQIAKEGKETTKKAAAGGEDDEGDAEEDEIWKALVNAQPDIDEDASDAGFDDMDDLDMGSDEDDSPALSLDGDDDEDEDDVSVEFGDDSEEEGSDDDDLVAPDVPDEDEEKGDKRKARRKMLRGLPTFASVDDYAELLAGDDDL